MDYFLEWELNWFLLVYNCTSGYKLHKFLEENALLPQEVSTLEIRTDNMDLSDISTDKCDKYYKVHFSDISALLPKRRTFLDKGWAYFSERDLIYYVISKLEFQFREQLNWNKNVLGNVTSENRIHDFISEIPVFISTVVNFSSIEVNLENIDFIAKEHYPLCMQNIHNILRSNHHLKYDCKMQYGIFLKWLGLPYEDALKFWKDEFTKVMTYDLYGKKYAYLFKHQYGMVGSKIQYRPYTCEQIIKFDPQPLQQHGCPFKHWSREKLRQRLKDDNFISTNIRDIEDLVEEGSYQVACTQYFCRNKKVFRDNVIQSPNQYCADSFQLDKDILDLLSSMLDSL